MRELYHTEKKPLSREGVGPPPRPKGASSLSALPHPLWKNLLGISRYAVFTAKKIVGHI